MEETDPDLRHQTPDPHPSPNTVNPHPQDLSQFTGEASPLRPPMAKLLPHGRLSPFTAKPVADPSPLPSSHRTVIMPLARHQVVASVQEVFSQFCQHLI